MFYDLNVPWAPENANLQRTLTFLDELGYDVVALTHTLSGKLPADLTCPIPNPLPFPTPASVKILRRCTLILTDPSLNHRIIDINAKYDVLALRPIDEKTLSHACLTADCDIISIDLTQRLPYYFKFKMLSMAIARGIRFELCYGPGILAIDSLARRNVISNTIQLIRATRGKGLIISSDATSILGCRSPWDVINLTAVWGLGVDRGKEALSTEARSTVAFAQLKRTSYRGVIDVVYGGEKPQAAQARKVDKKQQEEQQTAHTNKRKAADEGTGADTPVSNKEKKRREKEARHREKENQQ